MGVNSVILSSDNNCFFLIFFFFFARGSFPSNRFLLFLPKTQYLPKQMYVSDKR